MKEILIYMRGCKSLPAILRLCIFSRWMAIAASYEKEEKGMPPKTDKIVMALELFASNTEHPHEIKNNMRETREYWKQYIPEDGIRLDQLLERL